LQLGGQMQDSKKPSAVSRFIRDIDQLKQESDPQKLTQSVRGLQKNYEAALTAKSDDENASVKQALVDLTHKMLINSIETKDITLMKDMAFSVMSNLTILSLVDDKDPIQRGIHSEIPKEDQDKQDINFKRFETLANSFRYASTALDKAAQQMEANAEQVNAVKMVASKYKHLSDNITVKVDQQRTYAELRR